MELEALWGGDDQDGELPQQRSIAVGVEAAVMLSRRLASLCDGHPRFLGARPGL